MEKAKWTSFLSLLKRKQFGNISILCWAHSLQKYKYPPFVNLSLPIMGYPTILKIISITPPIFSMPFGNPCFLQSFLFIQTRRFYLTGDMTNLYPFIQGSLEWPFSELFTANVSLWNQYKYIAFNTFSCKILIISYKMLIITGICNEKTISHICRDVTIFNRQELDSLFQVQENWKGAGVQN